MQEDPLLPPLFRRSAFRRQRHFVVGHQGFIFGVQQHRTVERHGDAGLHPGAAEDHPAGS
ncbi:hypothetical protein LINGRAHAP2_LOCUS6170 [Linum grandiflorum]